MITGRLLEPLITDYVALTATARTFLQASIHRDRFLRWRITGGLATLPELPPCNYELPSSNSAV